MNSAFTGEGFTPAADLHKTESYNYELPEAQIAQVPAEPRDSSRLLVLGRRDFGNHLHHARGLVGRSGYMGEPGPVLALCARLGG